VPLLRTLVPAVVPALRALRGRRGAVLNHPQAENSHARGLGRGKFREGGRSAAAALLF
jgi:hypothetical protein